MEHEVDQAVLAFVDSAFENTEYLVALSGGLDSSVLLYALSKIQKTKFFNLEVIHVNHQLQDEANTWAEFCKTQCDLLSLECSVETVSIDITSGDSIEALARHARYAVFSKYMHDKKCLLTAHHADDQFETFLLQLFRGAGPKGLSSMAWQKKWVAN